MISRRELYAMGEPFGESCTRVEAGRLICGGGGGGGGKSTTKTEIPTELKPLAKEYTRKALTLARTPYEGYDGEQVEDLGWAQNAAGRGLAQQFFQGDMPMNAARNFTTKSLGSGSAATRNPYSGSNPYLQKNIDAALGDITRNYNDAVAPGLTTQMVGSGSFGNTGAQASTQNALNDLTKNLANTSAGMRMQDYTQQQQLAEQYAGRNDQMLGNMLGLAPGYQQQQLNAANAFMNFGNMQQDNQQQKLDAGYQNWMDEQNDPYKKLAAMAGVFSSGMGQTSTTKQSGGGGK